jgi:ribosomal-protein-alanine N-acetyltransferase
MEAEETRTRPGAAADLKAIAAIEQLVAINPWSLSQFVGSSLEENQHCMVLESGAGEIRGFAICQRVLDEATLLNIAVQPGYQGRGFGVQLLQALLEHLRGEGVHRILLEVRRGNERAIGLYRRFHFIDDGVRSGYYPGANGREDALLMSCQLGGRE